MYVSATVPGSRTAEVVGRVFGYVTALFLPALTMGMSFHSHALRDIPLAMSFASIAAVATGFGLGPALCATAVSVMVFNYWKIPTAGTWSLDADSIARSAVILTAGLMIAILSHKRRAAELELRSTLVALQEQADALNQAQQVSRSAAWVYTPADHRTRWLAGGSEIFGRPMEEIATLGSPNSLVLEEDRHKINAAAKHTKETGETFHVEFRVAWPNGEVHWLEARGKPSPADRSIWRGVTLDITDRKKAELALIRSEKLAAAGRLASTIAHEINNPLEAVTNLLYLARVDPSLNPEVSEYLRQADDELARLSAITRHTLSFVRTRPASGPVDLAEIVQSVIALFQARCDARGGDIRCTCPPNTFVKISSDELRQILTNLISNASDALAGPGGLINIKIVETSQGAQILVEDNGVGIPAENLERIFDPFFTTKDDTGTGIGLWVTKELVEKNGGSISVESGNLSDGCKTRFRMEFPILSGNLQTVSQ